MQVERGIRALRDRLDGARAAGRSIGFVPTMGAFHRGHLEIMRIARSRDEVVVVSIFVNPLQFGPSEDYQSYPRSFESDVSGARSEGVDVLFAPEPAEMYPHGAIDTRVDPGRLATVAEGAYRPGHFAGVATVCAKLFNIVQPHRVYLGQKDAQQVAVIRQMVQDLNLPLEVISCPTVREQDGLAMSSRNLSLSSSEREAAAVIPRALFAARAAAAAGERSCETVRTLARSLIEQQPLVRLQYLEIVDPVTFEALECIEGQSLATVAAYAGSTRLIDNVAVGTVPRPER